MAPPTALIAEDEPLLAHALQTELAKAWPELRVLPLAANGTAALEQALAQRPSVCFLDIRMPGLSGLEVAQALAEDWPEDANDLPLIVFVTAYDQYAVQAFETAAVDYLLKPVAPARLAQCCARLRETLARRSQAGAAVHTDPLLAQLRGLLLQHADIPSSPHRPAPLQVLQAAVGHHIHLVPVAEVLYFEAADKYVRVVTAERDYLIRTALRELLPQLDAEQFWQVHRGTVVRASAIHSIQRHETGKLSLVLKDGAGTLAVSRLYATRFKAM
ncbi:LytR/AlgR family response regulator transcription factor [Caldimonas brevitalea]|uniref:LytR family transcriptional regulator n=1 Tax=Caldimonas brevitalea TaxID=413882 RepID=A0A0G3BFW1_9BURK|nr:LytTR family DNA-binding domain-containing protein [Caldimonas brevitalea]AKJ28242.1 LytR family transcriptional regulator [Caldimonas brevitalea]